MLKGDGLMLSPPIYGHMQSEQQMTQEITQLLIGMMSALCQDFVKQQEYHPFATSIILDVQSMY
jgi:hypothetical protein